MDIFLATSFRLPMVLRMTQPVRTHFSFCLGVEHQPYVKHGGISSHVSVGSSEQGGTATLFCLFQRTNVGILDNMQSIATNMQQ